MKKHISKKCLCRCLSTEGATNFRFVFALPKPVDITDLLSEALSHHSYGPGQGQKRRLDCGLHYPSEEKIKQSLYPRRALCTVRVRLCPSSHPRLSASLCSFFLFVCLFQTS